MHVRGRVHKQQVSPKQTNRARLIELLGKMLDAGFKHASYQFPVSDTCYVMVFMPNIEQSKRLSVFKNLGLCDKYKLPAGI